MSTEPTDDAAEVQRLREELDGLADMGRKARDHYTGQIELLHRAILDWGGYPVEAEWPGNKAAIAAAEAVFRRDTYQNSVVSAQARFWADHFVEVDRANHRALGAYDRTGYTVAELIADVVNQLGQVTHQRDSLRDDVETIRGLVAAHVGEPVPSDVTTREAVQTLLDEIADLKRQLADAGEESPALLAERDESDADVPEFIELVDLLAAIRLYVPWRLVTVRLTMRQRELWADAVEAAGDEDAPVDPDRWWRDDTPAEHPDCNRTGMCQERHDHAPECLSLCRTDAEIVNGVYPDDAELAARRDLLRDEQPPAAADQLGEA